MDYSVLTTAGHDGFPDAGVPAGNVRVYDGNGWYVTVELSAIHGCHMAKAEDPDTGEMVESLVIPLVKSGLTVTPKRRVLAVYRAQVAQVATQRYSHLLTRVIDTATLAEMRRRGFRQGFEGHMRPASMKIKKKIDKTKYT